MAESGYGVKILRIPCIQVPTVKIGTILLITAFSILTAAACFAQEMKFPVPRAEKEFAKAVEGSKRLAETINGDTGRFLSFVSPYSPLDIQIKNGTYRESEIIKNMYFGAMGWISGVDPRNLTNEYHCGEKCTEARFIEISSNFENILKTLKSMMELKKIRILSQWGKKEEYRINDIYNLGWDVVEALPSPAMGFVPSGEWKEWDDIEDCLEVLGVDEARLLRVIADMNKYSIAAMVINKGKPIRIIHSGLSDNESGLLILADGAEAPEEGDNLDSGKSYKLIVPLINRCYYYETN